MFRKKVRHPLRYLCSLLMHYYFASFASVEISLILAKMHFTCDLELVDQYLDWEGQSFLYVNWWKPDLFVRFLPVQ